MAESEVEIFKVTIGDKNTDPRMEDERRTIKEIVFPEKFVWPFTLAQIKTITFTDEAVRRSLQVGNHYHTGSSNRHEIFVAVGPAGDLFEFRHRKPGGVVSAIRMQAGDACYVPPGHSHAFAPLQKGAALQGFSNQLYDPAHDVPDNLF